MADGSILNDYSGVEYRVSDGMPATPWAMYLSGDRARYDFLCFDLDSSKGNSAYDAGKLSLWLDELNVAHLVCESGPSGGRHVWVGLEEAVDGARVRAIAQLLSQLLPSLDPTPLLNPATGCVRPPGSPHRLGGASTPTGPLTALTAPSTSTDAIDALTSFLVDAGAELPAAESAPLRGMAVDQDGHPYISGPRRALSARIEAMLHSEPAEDTSITLASVLAGAAHARWRYADVLAYVDSPAFEHVRTRRRGPNMARLPRTPHGRSRTLTAAWADAVRYVAARPITATGDDTDYAARLSAALTAVEAAQERADTMPGLWGADRASSTARGHGGTHSTRAVLDALCLYMLQAGQVVIEADGRRLSQDTGYGRSTVYAALQALTETASSGDPESAWVVRVGLRQGAHGQQYRLSHRFSTESMERNRSQALVRPPSPDLTASKTYWTRRISHSLAALNHDVFAAAHSLGRTAGLIWKQLTEDTLSTVESIVRATGLDAATVQKKLRRLHSARLIRHLPAGWVRTGADALERAAHEHDVAGYLRARAARYSVERAVWGWWQAEYTWMTKRAKKRRGRRSPTGVTLFTQTDRPDYARYPRGPGHRADHRAARQLVEAGALEQPALRAA